MESGLRFILLVIVGLLATSVEADNDDCKPCPQSWSKFGQRCFRFYSQPLTWIEAEKLCLDSCGNLTSLRNSDETKYVRNLIFKATNKHTRSWLGGNDGVQEGKWLWSDGSKFDFSGWGPGEPNNQGDEDCMEINYGEKEHINDVDCTLKQPFVCSLDL